MSKSQLLPAPPPPEEKRSGLPSQVVLLGWVSLLTDAASEMIYPFLPELLKLVGAGAAALGVVEGCAEAVAAVCKYGFGRLSDRLALRKPFAVAGYVIATLARPFFAVAAAAWHVAVIRSVDRIGKGMRGPPRDALLAAGVPAGQRARAFGVQRMMDNLGGAIGPVVAFVLLRFAHVPLRTLFVISLVPGVAAVLVLALCIEEVRPPSAHRPSEGRPDARPRDPSRRAIPAEAPASLRASSPLPGIAKRFLLAFAVFSLASSTDAFLLQRLLDLGLDVAWVPLAWVSLQLAKSLVNVPGGRASDHFGHRRVLTTAWIFYGLVYIAFAFARSVPVFWGVMIIYALYYGLAEGGQRAILADAVPPALRGRAFGVMTAIEGGMVLAANGLFGVAYARLGPGWAFGAGGALALMGAMLLYGLTDSVEQAPGSPRTSA